MIDAKKGRPTCPNTKSDVTEHGGQVHQQREISPPQLKRKRTEYEQLHREQDPLGLTNPSILNSLYGQPAFFIDRPNKREIHARPSPILHSFRPPHAQSHNVSLRSVLGPSKVSKPASCKLACRVCDKTTVTSYNPIITCPECAKPYHDSCRKPPLRRGVEPERWRCLACSNGSGKPAKYMLESESVSVRHSVVRDIFKRRIPTVDSTRLSDKTGHIHTLTVDAITTSERWLASLDRPEGVFESSLQSEPKRSEIYGTPTCRSKQSNYLESLSQKHHVQAQPASSAPARVHNRTPPVALCSGCRQPSVFERTKDGNSQRHDCQLAKTMSHLEIPETPNATAPYGILPTTSSAESTVLMIAHSPTAGAESPAWFDPNRTSNLDHASTEPPQDGQQCEKEHQKVGTSKATQGSESPTCESRLIHGTGEIPVHLSPRRSHAPSTDNATVHTSSSEEQESKSMIVGCSPEAGNPSVSPEISTSPNMDGANVCKGQKRLTTRDLVRIALACANGSSMSAPQIIDWLVGRFPYLQQGQGSWEKSLKATLSFKEFRSNMAVGLSKACLVYSFANEADRTRYEKEYRDYVTNCPPGHEQQQDSRPAVVVELTGYVRNSAAPSMRRPSGFIPSPASTGPNDSTSHLPFTLSKFSFTRDAAECVSEIKRESSFHKAYSRSTQSSIEMMTAEEKVRKVAEIRERLSRKQLFDSGQRLAHVRRYRRQDPHDESDGAWKPQSVGIYEKPIEDDDDVAEDRDEHRSLRKVFGLPANAVPMLHEGNELAFRDGTMVNGRLPRPRHIYRVGKRLGAGLTVN